MKPIIKDNLIIFLVSFAILFIELVLVRFVSTEIRIFAYLQNFVLLACFLGIGLGSARSQQPCRLWVSAFLLSVLIGCICLPLNVGGMHLFKSIPTYLAAFADTVIHYQYTTANLRTMQALGVVLTLFIFTLNLFILFPLGQLMGKVFDEHPRTIEAYSVNVIASLLGVWAFSGLSFIYLPPWMWFTISGILIAALMWLTKKNTKFGIASLILLIVSIVFLYTTTATSIKHGMTIWSPYQKLTVRPITPYDQKIDPYITRSDAGYELDVNDVSFMFLANLSDKFRREYPEYFQKHPMYMSEKVGPTNPWNLPYSIKKDAQSVLILGAGAGDDAAAARRNGLKTIDIVEIDPGIVYLGQRYHPEQPYAAANVHVIIDDARAYFNRSHKKYDIIHLGLLDSHSQASTLNNMRMDHYVYTLESFREAKNLLKPEGIFVVSFYVQRLWLGQRVEELLTKTFGFRPIVVGMSGRSGKGKVVMITGHDQQKIMNLILNNPEIFPFIKQNTIGYENFKPDLKLTSDDWPYMYLTHPHIPTMHMIMIVILVVLLLLSRPLLLNKGEKIDWHFFFLGAAFLLLEFQNINKTSLLFGSTWLVNSINISAILFFILLANMVVLKFKSIKLIYPYICLAVCLLGIYLVPLTIYNSLSFWPRALVTSFILNLPIFFAGIIFTTSFKSFPKKHLALGSNLIGAAAGGLLEYLSYLFGVKALILVTLILYGFSLFSLKTLPVKGGGN